MNIKAEIERQKASQSFLDRLAEEFGVTEFLRKQNSLAETGASSPSANY